LLANVFSQKYKKEIPGNGNGRLKNIKKIWRSSDGFFSSVNFGMNGSINE